MEATELQRLFAAFVGADRYRKFLRTLNNQGRWRGRFLFWQEQLLKHFVGYARISEMTVAQVEQMLRVCDARGITLAFEIGNNARIKITPTQTDTYRVIVTSQKGGAPGEFTLEVWRK